MGIVTELNNDAIFVKMLNNGKNVIVTKETWKNREYVVEINEEGEKQITEKETGTFKQFPLQLYQIT